MMKIMLVSLSCVNAIFFSNNIKSNCNVIKYKWYNQNAFKSYALNLYAVDIGVVS